MLESKGGEEGESKKRWVERKLNDRVTEGTMTNKTPEKKMKILREEA